MTAALTFADVVGEVARLDPDAELTDGRRQLRAELWGAEIPTHRQARDEAFLSKHGILVFDRGGRSDYLLRFAS